MNKDIKNNLLDKVSPYLRENYDLTEASIINSDTIPAMDLLVKERIDLIAKLKWIEAMDRQLKTPYPEELYKAHLEAFSNGTFEELGNENKDSYQKYVDTFSDLSKNIKENGFNKDISLIPVGENMAISDGAHRTSSAIYYQKEISIIKLRNLKTDFGTSFFRKQLLNEEYLDYLVLEYCKLKSNTYVLCLWPRADRNKIEEAKNLIYKNSAVVYEKNIFLTYNGYRNFMIEAYAMHPWPGSYKNKHAGIISQLDGCYKEKNPLIIFVIEAKDTEEVLKLKEKIRNIFNVGNYSIHSTDNKQETLNLLNILLNKNSIFFLNYADPDKYPKFQENLLAFKEIYLKEKINLSDIIIDSSSVLAAFGLREAADLDYLTKNEIEIKTATIDCHNEYLKYYGKELDDLLYNPNHYFIYQGFKFVTLECLNIMKKRRNEKKDQLDSKLITNFLKNHGQGFQYHLLQWRTNTKRWVRNTNLKVRKSMKSVLYKIGLLNFTMKVYHKLKGTGDKHE